MHVKFMMKTNIQVKCKIMRYKAIAIAFENRKA